MKSLRSRIACFLGLHSWAYGSGGHDEDAHLIVGRVCMRCDRMQWTDWRDDRYMVRWTEGRPPWTETRLTDNA